MLTLGGLLYLKRWRLPSDVALNGTLDLWGSVMRCHEVISKGSINGIDDLSVGLSRRKKQSTAFK